MQVFFCMMESRKGGLVMNEKPLDYSTLTKEEFDAEIEERTHEIVFCFLL